MTKIIGYWEGYSEQNSKGQEQKPFSLSQVPDFYTHVPIAFCAPAKQSASDPLATAWEFDKTFNYTKDEVFSAIAELKQKPGNHQKILLSFQDTPEIHWFPNVDIDAFAKQVASDLYKYNIDGINIDAESGMALTAKIARASLAGQPDTWSESAWNMLGYKATKEHKDPYVPTFTKLIKTLRSELDKIHALKSQEDPTIEKKLLSYTCYTQSKYDKEILAACKTDIDYLTTMAYWDNFGQSIELFEHYAKQIGDRDKVGIGVKCPPGGDATPLTEVRELANWLRQHNHNTMMLWSATRDVTAVSGLANQAYGRSIAEIMLKPRSELLPAKDYDLDDALDTLSISSFDDALEVHTSFELAAKALSAGTGTATTLHCKPTEIDAIDSPKSTLSEQSTLSQKTSSTTTHLTTPSSLSSSIFHAYQPAVTTNQTQNQAQSSQGSSSKIKSKLRSFTRTLKRYLCCFGDASRHEPEPEPHVYDPYPYRVQQPNPQTLSAPYYRLR